jgi:hypothetical protein
MQAGTRRLTALSLLRSWTHVNWGRALGRSLQTPAPPGPIDQGPLKKASNARAFETFFLYAS